MKVLLAVSGSIAAYKSYDLLRELIKNKHQVKVVLSAGALKFIRSETFRYLGAEDVYESQDDFNPQKLSLSNTVVHIELARWTEAFVLYPASANMISKLSFGQCHDLCSSIFLSLEKSVKKIIFPAMNKEMYTNEITQNNLKLLDPYIVTPNTGTLACGEEGKGKLPLPEEALDLIETISASKNSKKVLISTGATLSPLDSVRYLTNPSSGITGYHLAKEFLKQGFDVELIYSVSSTKKIQNLNKNQNISLHQIKTTKELSLKTKELFESCDVFISAAAPCDIEFDVYKKKLKKSELETTIDIKHSEDIIKACLKLKKSSQKIIGFAAEISQTQEEENILIEEKLKRKPVDLLIFNQVNNGINGEKKGFGQNQNTYKFILKGDKKSLNLTKKELAQKISQQVILWFKKS